MAVNKTSLSAGEIIRAILMEDTEVSSKVNKIFPVTIDMAELPYITYRRASLQPTAVKSPAPNDLVAIELLCCAESYSSSIQLAEAVRASLDGAQAEHNGLRMRSCVLADAEELAADDAFIQKLMFNIKI